METYEEILGRMQGTFEELAGYPADDASDIGIRLRVLAGEVYSLTAAMDWLEQQFFTQTAQDEQLDLRAQEHGIQRRPAQAAAGELTFSRAKPLWYRAVIDKGTVCALPGEDGARYVTTEEAVLAVGSTSVTVPAEAEQPGRDGNAAAGTVTTLITVPPGIEQVTNQKPFTGGADPEGDESLRARLTQSYAALPNGTNAAFYRNQALKDEGVFSANVVPKEQGLGTVGVYLGASGAAADSETVQRVQAMFDELREINVLVTVAAAQTVSCPVTVQIVPCAGMSFEAASDGVEEAVQAYFAGLGVGEPVRAAALTAKIFATGVVEDCTLVGSAAADRVVKANQLAVLQDVTVQEASA